MAQAAPPPQEEEPAAEDAPPAPSEPAEPAESGEEASGEIEVMHVKGRAISEIETDVPSSITQFDASTIEALGAQDISDLSRVTPNVNIVQPGSTQATFFVRGIGLSDFSSNAAGAVTIFQDDVAINAPAIQTGQLYDVEGVEVLRGPQGTGPFRNASAGAIRVRSKRPTGNYSSVLRSSLGYYDTEGDKGAAHALIQDYEGALEMPIVEGLLSSRFAFRLRDAEPYKKNGCGNAPPFALRAFSPRRPRDRTHFNPTFETWSMCGELSQVSVPNAQRSTIPTGLPRLVNDEHNWAARGTFRLTPEDTDGETEFFLNLHGSQLDQDSTLGQAIGTSGGLPGSRFALFGGTAPGGGYIDDDVFDEHERICARFEPGVPDSLCSNPFASRQLAKNLASGRPLDEKPYRGDYNRVGKTTRDAWGGFVSGEREVLGEWKLFGLASYDGYDRFSDTDTDFTSDQFFEIVQADFASHTYEELRLSGELQDQPIEWTVGGYYLGQNLHTDATITLAQFNTTVLRRIFSEKLDSFAGWGQFTWDFADDLTLDAGVRYNFERKAFHYHRIQSVGGFINEFEGNLSAKQDETWQTPTGSLVLTYHLDESTSAYAKYARGFKAGHFNSVAAPERTRVAGSLAPPTVDDPPADEEYNDSWEAGFSGSWLAQRIFLRGAFFYYRYENYQVFLFTDSPLSTQPPVLAILNAKQAENYGVELEGTFAPLRGWAPRVLEGLRLSGNFSWLHGEYLDFSTVRIFNFPGVGVFPVVVDYSGRELQNAPQYKVSATAEWTLALGRFGFLIPRYDMNWSDDVFFDPNEGHGSVDPTGGPQLIDFAIGQKAYFLHNARLAYRTPSGNVEIAAWVRNIEDQVYKNFAFDASRFSGLVINFPGEPRSIGIDVIFTF